MSQHSILNLFGAVIAPDFSSFSSDPEFLSEYGVLVEGKAVCEINEIKSWLEQKAVNGRQLNSSFHKSWEKIASTEKEELLAQQILHYFSTYGLQSLGIYDNSLIYIPQETLNIPEILPIKVIYALPEEKIIEKCLKLLASGMSMKQETITDIFAALDECGYEFTGKEDVRNREAQVMIIDRLGKLPEDPMLLFRYLVYKATSETLIIKNQSLIDKIKNSSFQLPDLYSHEVALSEHFNRLKPLWLAFKSNQANKAVVNKIAKLSKKHHKPQSPNILLNISKYADCDRSLVVDAVERANIYQLVRAYNSLANKQALAKYYRIRNGKGFSTKVEQASTTERDFLIKVLLLSEIKSRFKSRLAGKKIYVPYYIDYAIPTSEKQMLGNIPYGTKISLLPSDDFLLAGIYWEGENTDLDLRCTSFTSDIGWNSNHRSGDLGLMFSGDVTSAPNGASEYLYSQKIEETYLIKVNEYRSESDLHPFKLILGYGSDITENYIIDPNRVVFQLDMYMSQNEVSLGILTPGESGEGIDLYLSGTGTGESRVGSNSKFTDITREAIASQTKNMLRLRDILGESQLVSSPDDADIDLSPNSLTKETFFQLF